MNQFIKSMPEQISNFIYYLGTHKYILLIILGIGVSIYLHKYIEKFFIIILNLIFKNKGENYAKK